MSKPIKHKLQPDKQWEDIRGIVNQTIRKFIRDTKWEIDWEEAWAEAGLVFAECAKTLDRMRASLATYVCYRVYKRLLSLRRKEARRHKIIAVLNESDAYENNTDESDYGLQSIPSPESELRYEFDLLDFLDALPSDAAAVVWIAMCPPTRLRRQTEAALKSYLSKAGWDKKRINRAFKTVRKRLK